MNFPVIERIAVSAILSSELFVCNVAGHSCISFIATCQRHTVLSNLLKKQKSKVKHRLPGY